MSSRFRADAEIAVQVLHENGGFSLTRQVQAANGQGYFASYQGYEETVELDKFDADAILSFRRRNISVLRQDISNLLGGWLHEGLVYLDIARVFFDLQEALSFATANSQIAIWDGYEGKEIMVNEGRTGSSDALVVQKLQAMFTHPILSEAMVEDDPLSNEGEDDPELQGWNGLLQGDMFQPALASTLPSGSSTKVTKVSFDWSAPEEDSGEESVYKAVWNKEQGVLIWQADEKGLPTHDQMAMETWGRKTIPGKDWILYAVPEGNNVEIESYKSNCPYEAFAAVKEQIAKLHSGANIIIPDYAGGGFDAPDAIGSSDVPVTSHLRAATWAEKTFPQAEEIVRARVGPLGMLGFRTKLAEADKKGCMVALYIPSDVAEELAIKGGEPADDLHITLAYFEEKGADRDDWSKAIGIAESVALQHGTLEGKISGVGVFHLDDGDVLWASPSIPGLAEFRTDLVDALNRAGFKISDTYGYQPHITLKYEFKGKPPRLGEDDHTLRFNKAFFVREEERTALPFSTTT